MMTMPEIGANCQRLYCLGERGNKIKENSSDFILDNVLLILENKWSLLKNIFFFIRGQVPENIIVKYCHKKKRRSIYFDIDAFKFLDRFNKLSRKIDGTHHFLIFCYHTIGKTNSVIIL